MKVSSLYFCHKSILTVAEHSLERLGIKTIDLYQIHIPYIPLKGAIKAFDELGDNEKIRYIGVSNFGIKRLKKVQTLTKHEIVSIQVSYSLAELKPEEKLLLYIKETGIKIIAYSPLGQEMVTGKYSYKNRLKHKGWRQINKLFSPENLKRSKSLLNKLKTFGKKYGKTPTKIALNWLISNNSVIVIPGAKNLE